MSELAFFQRVLQECPDVQSLVEQFDVSDGEWNRHIMHPLYHRFISVTESARSDTFGFLSHMALIMHTLRVTTVIVLRNDATHVEHLVQRVQESAERCQVPIRLHLPTDVTECVHPSIVVRVAHGSSLRKWFTGEVPPYALFLDDASTLLKSTFKSSSRYAPLMGLRANALLTIGISMLPWDASTDSESLVSIPFHRLEGRARWCRSGSDDVFQNHEDLIPFLTMLSQKVPVLQPNIAFVSIGVASAALAAQQQFMVRFPSIVTLVHQASGITFCYEGKEELVGPSVAELLQWMKQEGGLNRFPTIVIFGAQLDGNGIAMHDLDGDWQVTHLYVTHGNVLDVLHCLRVCSRRPEYVPLTWYSTARLYREVIEMYVRYEHITLSDGEAVTKPVLPEDWLEDPELRRLRNKMIPKWSQQTSHIAAWLDEVDPRRLYSRDTMIGLCQAHGICLNHVCSRLTGGYGPLLTQEKDGYRLHPSLVDAYDAHVRDRKG